MKFNQCTLITGMAICTVLVGQARAQQTAPRAAPDWATTITGNDFSFAPDEQSVRAVYLLAGDSWLGVGLADLTSARVSELHLSSENGAEVREVYPGSPAAAAGVKTNDVIVGFNDENVTSVRELTRLISETPSDRTVSVKLMRDGKPLATQIHLAERPAPVVGVLRGPLRGQLAPAVAAPISPLARIAPAAGRAGRGLVLLNSPGGLGMQLEVLTPQLEQYFGLKKDQRAPLVSNVTDNSAAAKAGVQAGDLLLRFGSTDIANSGELSQAIVKWRRDRQDSSGSESDNVALTVLRRGKEMTLQLKMPLENDGLIYYNPADQQWDQAEKLLAQAQAQVSALSSQELANQATQEIKAQEKALEAQIESLRAQLEQLQNTSHMPEIQ